MDLLLIILSIVALFKGPYQGALLGFGYGLLEDLFLGHCIGMYALTKMVIGYLLGFSKNNLNQENWLAPGLLAFLATIGQGLFILLLGNTGCMDYPWLFGLLVIILPMAFYNGSFTLLGYSFFQGGAAWVARKRRIGSQR